MRPARGILLRREHVVILGADIPVYKGERPDADHQKKSAARMTRAALDFSTKAAAY